MVKHKSAQCVRLRILVVGPPPGVRFAVQRGRSDLLEPSSDLPDAIRFEFTLRLGAQLADGAFNFLGECAQGSPSDRFVYVNSGTLAGQADSCWSRRAKLKLAAIPRALVEAAAADAGAAIEARVIGTLGDGGPVCASVKSQAIAWRLVQHGA